MTEIYIDGLARRTNLGTVTGTVGDQTDSVNIPSYRQPSAITGLPRLSDGFDTDTLTVATTGLTGITAYDWREVGGATLSATSTLAGTGHGGKYVECEVTCDQGVLVSPPIMVYASTMMGMAMDPDHLVDDASIVNLVPHTDITHLAIANGNWNTAATWRGGKIPRNGARVLIPNGITVTYNNNNRYRLDWLRVDGVLTWAIDQSTDLMMEHLIGTRGSEILMGTGANPIPEPYQANITISGQDYRTTDKEMSDLNRTRDPALWGRCVVSQGVWRIWGDEKLSWSNADPMEIGATSCTLHKVPTGWAVGKEIVIFGTKGLENGTDAMTIEDEVRTITDITGSVVSWDAGEPLIYPHKNQLAGSTRTDLYPKIMLKSGHNVTIQGEVTDIATPWRRGHTAGVHHHAVVDHWFCNFLHLGRTDKPRPVGKRIAGDLFRVFDYDGPNDVTDTAMTAQSNISARYPVHMHHLGFNHTGARPIVHGCYVEGTPGWGMVHHACDVDFETCAIYNFAGAGMVAESGNELGGWIDNIAGSCILPTGSAAPAKLEESLTGGLQGDNFKKGYAFAYRGRAVRATGNVGCSCPWGHIFYHRGGTATAVFPQIHLERENIDLGDAGYINVRTDPGLGPDKFRNQDYPIVHFKDNESIGCLGGLHITKGAPQQGHDVNIKIKNFRAWGFYRWGMAIEYIGNYVLDNSDVVGLGADGYFDSVGIDLAANVFQLATINSRVEGVYKGLARDLTATDDDVFTGAFDAVTDPRFLEVGTEFIDVVTARPFTLGAENPVAGTPDTWIREDFDDSLIDYDLDPSDTYPLILGNWAGINSMTNAVTNADGLKVSNFGSTMPLSPKVWSERIYAATGAKLNAYGQFNVGWFTADIGSGLEEVVKVQDIISDPLTARPFVYTKFYTITDTTPPGVDNGTITYSATPVTQSNKIATVAAGGSVVIDVVTGATGGDGVNYVLYKGKYGMSIKPDNGVAVLDYVNGTVTYTPDRDMVSGTDEMYVFVESGTRVATVRIDILIGPGGAVSAPTVPTVTDHAVANTIGVQLLAPPSAGGRRIDLVQYSTDAGATWRKLSNGWVQAVHKVTVESADNGDDVLLPLSAGNYNVQIRYKTNYDRAESAATTAQSVTVT